MPAEEAEVFQFPVVQSQPSEQFPIYGDLALAPVPNYAQEEYVPPTLYVVAESDDPNGTEALPTAEKLQTVQDLGNLGIVHADVVLLDSFEGDEESRQRYGHFATSVALRRDVKSGAPLARKRRSAFDNLREAAAGDEAAFEALLVDNRAHVYEIRGGVGESMTVEMDIDEAGRFLWAGQDTEDRQHFALSMNTDAAVMPIVHAEGLNAFRIEDRARDGQLEELNVYEFSPTAEASRDVLAERGYLLNPIALSMRRTRIEGDKCEIKSTFFAGVDQRTVKPQRGETAEDEAIRQTKALEMRFDIRVVRSMYKFFGVENADTMNVAQMLAKPVATRLDDLQMMMLYDYFAAQEAIDGEQTFFGSVELWQQIGSPEKITREHYEQHLARQEERHHQYESLCVDITNEQIRRHEKAPTPQAVAELKRRVVLEFIVKDAIDDESIEINLGHEANNHIHQAREAYARGATDEGDKSRQLAQQTARDPSCPGGAKGSNSEDGPDGKGPLDFNCPACGTTNTRPMGGYVMICKNPACPDPTLLRC